MVLMLAFGSLLLISVFNAGSAIAVITPIIQDYSLKVTFFGQDKDFDLRSITRRETDVAFDSWRNDAINGKLFEVVLRANNGRGTPLLAFQLPKDYKIPPTDEINIDNHSRFTKLSSQLKTEGDKRTLILKWEEYHLKPENTTIDVTITLVAYEKKSGIRWQIAINNRSKRYGVWLVRFPYLHFQPIGNTPFNDYLVYPKGMGRIIPNPFNKSNRQRYRFTEQSLSYPSIQLNMQWGALYDSELGGLYWATYDPSAHQKNFFYHARDDGVWFHLVHYPSNMGQPGMGYRSPYAFVIQYTQGHWYDAAQIYRKWALKQVWTSKGPLTARQDIPQWYKDSPLVFVIYTRGDSIKRIMESTLLYQKFFGYKDPIPLNWYNWWKYRPKETSINKETAVSYAGNPFPAKAEFKDAVSKLMQVHVYTQPYVNARVFDIPGEINNIPANLAPYAVKDVNGYPRLWNRQRPGLVDMCRFTGFYQNYIQDVSMRLAREFGAKGAYLDQFPGLSHACFDPDHGHPLGGGDWQFYAMRDMATKARNATKTLDKDAVFSGESGADAFIDVLDGNLYQYDIWPGIIPLNPAIYGGYWIHYGRSIHFALTNDVKFRLAAGNLFTYGAKLGRFSTDNDVWLTNSRYAKNMQLLKKLVEYRVAAKDYLQYGRLLRPIDFESKNPDVNYQKFVRGKARGEMISQPAIMSSVWEAPDSSVGIILFNISGKQQDYRFTFMSNYYPILNHKVELFQLLADGSKKFLKQITPSSLQLNGQLAADEVRIFILR
jgi:hypothetical protein